MVGAAWQHGCIPVSEAGILRAIELNGTNARANAEAFSWGRAVAIDGAAVDRALQPTDPAPEPLDPRAAGLVAEALIAEDLASGALDAGAMDAGARGAEALDAGGPSARPDAGGMAGGPGAGGMDAGLGAAADLTAAVTRRVSDLIGYQSVAYARAYVASVAQVWRTERDQLGPDQHTITEAYADGLHHLMAYKDEYEVARLHLLPSERTRREQAFGPGARVRILLHPPVLRSLGLRRKLQLGRWFHPAMLALRAGRRLRGTALDPFGVTAIRRTERRLIGEYQAAVAAALAQLTPATADDVRRAAAAARLVKGYEHIKLASVEAFRAELSACAAVLDGQLVG
jgi:indolepyruvate ferredoxin oxidoreductase